MLRLRLHRIWAVCTKQYPKTLKTLGISRVKRQSYHKLTTIVSGKADACKMQASAFFRCRKITDENVLNGSLQEAWDYPGNENRALHSSETLCFCMSIIGFACSGASCSHCSKIRMKQFRGSRRLFVQRELLGEYMICLFYAVFRPISQGILFTT